MGLWRIRSERGSVERYERRCVAAAFMPCCVEMIASQRGVGTKDERSRNQTRHDPGLY